LRDMINWHHKLLC